MSATPIVQERSFPLVVFAVVGALFVAVLLGRIGRALLLGRRDEAARLRTVGVLTIIAAGAVFVAVAP